jgi:large subunit ribosomal protein L13
MKKKHIKSFYPKADSLNESWVLYDAKDKVLGRAATEIASIVLGKNAATYTPGVHTKQHVIVINAEKVVVTGKKYTDKMYYRHSGYPGGLKETTFKLLLEKKPTEPLKKAVAGMLPKNPHGRLLQRKVLFYAGEEHNHEAQQPVAYTGG